MTEGSKPDKGLADIIWERVSSNLGTSTETVQKIRFGQGAVGKVAVIAVFVVLSLGGIGIRVGGMLALWAIGAILLVAVLVLALVFYIVWKRPALAVMEGAELLHHQNSLLFAAAKGQEPVPLKNAGPLQPGLTIAHAETDGDRS